jgi:glycosyltransferase involved in cell wall biosynthesis
VDALVEIPRESQPGIATRIFRRLAKQIGLPAEPEPVITDTLLSEKVDALFSHRVYPVSPGVPLIGWIADFQHLRLPEMYSPDELNAVRKYHRDIIAQSSAMLVSSNDVLKDFHAFAPGAPVEPHVVPFVAQLPEGIYDSDPASVCGKYHIPERFFYLPNQFWKHKNHLIVLDALKILADRSVEICVVSTGSTGDWRNSSYFSSVLMEIATRGIHSQFRALGLIPRADVYRLCRQSLALLQPSLFEGWSTSIEEAKTIGKQVIASDIPIHLEQIPDATFFEARNAQSLADKLQQVAQAAIAGPDLAREAAAKADFRRRELEFGRRFVDVVKQAVSSKAK